MQALGGPPPDLGQQSGRYTGYPQREEPPKPSRFGGATRSKAVEYTLKGLGLVGVAVVSGLLWYLIRNNPSAPTHPPVPTQSNGAYTFEPYHSAQTDADCSAHATKDVRTFFRREPCVSLTRSLYTTKLADDERVITSVVVVRMTTPAQAADLRRVSDLTGSGHIKDLVEDGVAVPGGPHWLQDGGYDSAVSGSDVIVTTTEYVDNTQDTPANLTNKNADLKAVSTDAIRLGQGS
jgi:hypothetical protein